MASQKGLKSKNKFFNSLILVLFFYLIFFNRGFREAINTTHKVFLEPDSKIVAICGQLKLIVSSAHHHDSEPGERKGSGLLAGAGMD
jgi:hypothetical protein